MKNIAQMFEGPAHNLVWKNQDTMIRMRLLYCMDLLGRQWLAGVNACDLSAEKDSNVLNIQSFAVVV